MRVAHIKASEQVQSFDCPKCGSGGAVVIGWYHNGWLPMSRREQRRARKARKNLHMYKTCGKRPWHGADESWDMIAWCARRLASPWILSAEPFLAYKRKMHEFFLKDLRGQSGFAAMSRVADAFIEAEPRPAGCQCQWEAGDSPCRIH